MTAADKFSWELAGPGGTPYWQQGSDTFESEDMVALRAALKKDPRVTAELAKFWSVYEKEDGKITKAEYLKVHIKYTLALIPDILPDDARQAGEEDWASDMAGYKSGAGSMDMAQLYSCLFELADMWVNSVDGAEYASFLSKLFRRVTVKYIMRASGQVRSDHLRCVCLQRCPAGHATPPSLTRHVRISPDCGSLV